MNVVLLHYKQYTRRGTFNFHNCSDIKIHKNSTKTFKITYATYITAFLLFIMLLVSFSLFHFGDDFIS